MIESIVRLESITLENFKNIKRGQLSFANHRKAFRTSILGLYGQNGSGKTALIDAIELLQYALKGLPVPPKFADFISVDSDCAMIHYTFTVSTETVKYQAFYDFKLKAEQIEDSQNLGIQTNEESRRKAVIFEEVLSYAYEDINTKIRKSPLIDTTSSKVFAPVAKYNCLIGKDRELAMNLMIDKKVTGGASKSFIFSRELLTAIRNNTDHKENPEYQRHLLLIESLVRYGNFELFIINTANTGIISLNALPLAFKYENGANAAVGNIVIPLENDVV